MRKIVVLSGSSRPGSYTARALGVVFDELAKRGAEPSFYDASELALAFPGRSETDDGRRLTAAVAEATGVVLGTPEYHGSFSAMIKLAIESLGFPSVLKGKPVALVGVAAGRIGAVKSLEHLRGVCAHVGAIVMPGAISIAGVRNVFDAAGRCTDASSEQALRGVAAGLLDFIRDFVCPKHVLEEMVRADAAPPWVSSV